MISKRLAKAPAYFMQAVKDTFLDRIIHKHNLALPLSAKEKERYANFVKLIEAIYFPYEFKDRGHYICIDDFLPYREALSDIDKFLFYGTSYAHKQTPFGQAVWLDNMNKADIYFYLGVMAGKKMERQHKTTRQAQYKKE